MCSRPPTTAWDATRNSPPVWRDLRAGSVSSTFSTRVNGNRRPSDPYSCSVPLETNPTASDRMTNTEISTEEQPAEPIVEKKVEETPFEAVASICSVLVVGLFILTFLGQNFVIPS